MPKEQAKKKVEPKNSVPKKAVAAKKRVTASKNVKKVNKTPIKEFDKNVEKAEVINTDLLNECKYCHEHFAKGLTICPACRKSQKSPLGQIVITILFFTLLICIVCTHFIEKYYGEKVSESDYKYGCQLVSYESLVRNSKDYKNKDIKVIGKVTSVEGADLGSGNKITVKIDVNLFDGPRAQEVIFDFYDQDYKTGLLIDDVITVYGEYFAINGNTPFIKAKYIVFGT